MTDNEVQHLREILDERTRRFEEVITSLKTLLDERYTTQAAAIDKAFEAAEKAVNTALESAEQAVQKAEAASDKRFESVNEFRGQLSDQTAQFVTRVEHTALKERLDLMTGSDQGSQATKTTIRASAAILLTLVIAVVTILIGN